MVKLLRVLMIDDSEDSALSLVQELQAGGYAPMLQRVDNIQAMVPALNKEAWDMVVCDCKIPHFDAADALRLFAETKLDVPFIIISGAVDNDSAVVSTGAGAYDYITKDSFRNLIPVIEDELAKTQARRERQQMEKTLQESEHKYRQLVENLQEGILVIDRDGRTTFVNQRLVEMLGYTTEEMMGKNLFAFMEESSVDVLRYNPVLRKQGRQEKHEFTFLRKDGMRIYTRLQASLMKSDTGDYNGAIIAVEDITERRQVEELFWTISESSPVGIYIVQGGKFQYVNPGFQRATGYSEEELIGMNSLAFVHPEDKDMVRDNAIAMLTGKRGFPYEYRVIHKSGDVRWVMETVTSFQYRGWRAVLGNYMDITDRKQLERRMFEYEELNKLKSNLLSTVSHELRTPLATIKGYSTMLLDYDHKLGHREKLECLESIDRATDKLTELIDHLLDMSRLEAGLLKLQKAPADIAHLLSEVLCQAQMRLRNHRLTLNLSAPLPLVNIDARRVWQVLDNIIENAAKYSEDGTEVTISARRENGAVLVSITDQGVGIPADELDKVFDRFYRIEQRLTPNVRGFGLGLAICKGLIQAHGSRIWVESQPGQGSTFFFTLPVYEEKLN